MNRREWYERVFAQIRFKPDHPAIWKELKGHLDDKRDALIADGFSSGEANRRSLEAMGDPEELGRQLDAAHKPLLGWLWKVSGWLVLAALIAVLVCLWRGWDTLDWDRYPEDNAPAAMVNPDRTTFQYGGGRIVERQWSAEGGGGDTWNRYTFRVEYAALWEGDLYATLKVSGFLPWESALDLDEFYAVDSLGNRYENFQSIYDNWFADDESGAFINFISYSSRGLFSREYIVNIWNVNTEAQWIELRHDRTGVELAIRIDLPGGESA